MESNESGYDALQMKPLNDCLPGILMPMPSTDCIVAMQTLLILSLFLFHPPMIVFSYACVLGATRVFPITLGCDCFDA